MVSEAFQNASKGSQALSLAVEAIGALEGAQSRATLDYPAMVSLAALREHLEWLGQQEEEGEQA